MRIFAVLLLALVCAGAGGQQTFAVASIRVASEHVPFEHDGTTTFTRQGLDMHDVTVATCIRFAYDVQAGQLSGPAGFDAVHYDIHARADGPATEDQMKGMMQALLADRFKLVFHRERREIKVFRMVVAGGKLKTDSKLKVADPPGEPSHQNQMMGVNAKSWTMARFAAYLSVPLQTPVVDKTGLSGPYDFAMELARYMPTDNSERPDAGSIINLALQGELGLKLEPARETMDVIVVDEVQKPTEN